MRYLYTYIIVLLLSALCCLDASSFELKHTASFSSTKVKTEDIEVKGTIFTSVSYDDFIKTGKVGEARLPYDILEFEVPSDIFSFTISVKADGEHIIPLSHGVEISQEPTITGYSPLGEPALIANYTSSKFPEYNAVIAQDGYRNGDIHMLHVAVYPFCYDSENNRLTFVESIEVTINEARGLQPKSSLAQTFTSPLRPLEKLESVATRKQLLAAGEIPPTPMVGNGLPAYEYTVVTSHSLAPAFNKIVGLKRQKGLDAGIVCIEDILADAAFSKGDTISGINDDAGKLRAYLMACRQAREGDMFVLLGGNQDTVPVRNAYEPNRHYVNVETVIENGIVKQYKEDHPLGDRIPTDWYYIDVNGNWDLNKDSLYAYNGDLRGLDFNPDIYVGRICCKNKKEVDNYTYKLLKYEMNPGNGDFAYLGRELNTQSDDMQESNQAYISRNISKEIFNEAKIYEELPNGKSPAPHSPFASEIIDDINNNGYGFINHHAHGGVLATNVKAASLNDSIRYGLVSQQKIPKKYTNMRYEEKHGLDMITNYDKPTIFYSLACDLMPYDNMLMYVPLENDIYGDFEKIIPYDYYNFGDSFTIGGLYGGPGFIGNTRFGYVSSSFDQEKIFLNFLKTDGCLGRIRAKTQAKYTGSLHCRLTNNLLGCPEFKMWIKTPQIINYTFIRGLSSAETSIFADAETFVTCISLYDGSIKNIKGSSSNKNCTFTFPSANVVTTLNGEYKIPQAMNLSLNGALVKANGYFFVKNITTPQAMVPYIPQIKFSHAHITFDVDGYVDLKQPLIIDNGSDVTFVATGATKFSQIEIRNGSRLTIDSNGYTLEGESICELGSELIIK